MTTWVFEGTVLPAGEATRLEYGGGDGDVLPGRYGVPGLVDSHLGLTGDGNLVTYDADPREHPDVLATPAAVILNHRRIR
jgi:hypothetical protein